MSHGTKIATCCYCGTRAALVLKGAVRHELACSACGAPLHHLKMLRTSKTGDRELRQRPAISGKARSAKPVKTRQPKPRKRRKSLMSRVFEEAFDAIDDIFD